MKILDLTLPISDKIPAFPGSPKPNFIQWENLKDDGYNLELLFLSSQEFGWGWGEYGGAENPRNLLSKTEEKLW